MFLNLLNLNRNLYSDKFKPSFLGFFLSLLLIQKEYNIDKDISTLHSKLSLNAIILPVKLPARKTKLLSRHRFFRKY